MIKSILEEIKDSIVSLFTNYEDKKRELRNKIAELLSYIFLFKEKYETGNRGESSKISQQDLYSKINSESSIVRCLLTRYWRSKEEYGGMLYRYFIDKFDLNAFSISNFKEDSPITKEEILDKNLLKEYLSAYKL